MIALTHPYFFPQRPATPLDAYTANALGVWSVSRRLLGSHAGALIRVRANRAGQPERDIGFRFDNTLDLGALRDFAGASSCYVVKVYNQLAGGADMEQATASPQPQIVNAGAVILDSFGRPAMRHQDSQRLAVSLPSVSWPFTLYARLTAVAAPTYRGAWGLSPNVRWLVVDPTEKYYVHGGLNTPLLTNAQAQVTSVVFATAAGQDIVRVDGVDSGSTGGAGADGQQTALVWGDTTSFSGWRGLTSDLILYHAAHTSGTLSAVEAVLAA